MLKYGEVPNKLADFGMPDLGRSRVIEPKSRVNSHGEDAVVNLGALTLTYRQPLGENSSPDASLQRTSVSLLVPGSKSPLGISVPNSKLPALLGELYSLQSEPKDSVAISAKELQAIIESAIRQGGRLENAAAGGLNGATFGNPAYGIGREYAEALERFSQAPAAKQGLLSSVFKKSVDWLLGKLNNETKIATVGSALALTTGSIAAHYLKAPLGHSFAFFFSTYAVGFATYYPFTLGLFRARDLKAVTDERGIIDLKKWKERRLEDLPFVVLSELFGSPVKWSLFGVMVLKGMPEATANVASTIAGAGIYLTLVAKTFEKLKPGIRRKLDLWMGRDKLAGQ